ncbi:MAG: HEAT repeat domain-containing protein [Methanomicrobiaceae archaeon]|uniref:HEAT repeat domain-containing protein n=1 Tax=Methanoculleus sp. TaxID=90427 RepID=UPI00320CF851|nr:HEAT repeat domain-containing protein [Methanomicrobiaceae archaeon]
MAFFDRFRTNVERLREEKDYPGLIGVLDAEDTGSRADAARALSALGAPAIPDLLGALENAGTASRARMTETLASVGAPSIPLFLALILRAGPALQASIARAIAGAGDGMVEALLPALHHKQPAIRRAAVIALRETGKKAVPYLSGVLHDRNTSVRKEAADALAALRWVPDDLTEKVWFYYIREDWTELAKLQGAAVPVLLKALGSKESRIRSESARTLGKIHDERAIPALIGAVKDPAEMDVRIRAVEALGEIGDDRARPALVEALNDPHHQVRMEAAWALGRLGWIPQSDLERAEYLIAREQWNELVRMGRAAIPPLIRALEVEYSGVRTGASEALRQLGQPALGALNAEAASKNPARQQRAQTALEYIRRCQVEASRNQPAPQDSSRYEKELKEGLAIQRRFESQFGRPEYARSGRAKDLSPPPKKKETPAPESPEKPAEQAGKDPGEAVSIEDLLKESRRAEEAWAQVKTRLRTEAAAPAESITLEQLIPLEFEDAIAGIDNAGEQEEEPVREEPRLQELEIPELPRETPEPAVAEPVPEKTPLERCLEALRSGDEEIRAAAVAALQSMGEEAIGYLIEALKDPHYGVRIAAAEGLGEIGDGAAVEALVLLSGDVREDVRIAAARALGCIGDRRSIQPLIRLFGDRYHGVRVAAADAVVVFGRDALGPLEEALDDPVPAVRVTAAKTIGLIGAGESVPVLIEHLGDAAPEVRWSVARALADFGSLAVEPLFLVLRKGRKEMRLAAIDALWEVPGKRADEVLLYALEDDDEDVREKATAALKKRQVINVWRRALGSQVLAEESTPKKARSARLEDKKAFEQSGRQEIDTLITALKDKTWSTQLGAATRLIMMGRPAVDGLIRALRDENPDVQTAAASLLGEMRETAVAPLMDALSDTDRFVRLVAARNLGKIGNRRAIEALIGSLHREPDGEVRATVAEALGYMGSGQAIEPLALALRDRDELVKIAAARSLGYMGDNRALEPLILALSDVDDRVRHAAIEALKDPGDTVRGYLVGALRSGDEKFRAGAAEALSASGWVPENGGEEALYLMARDRWADVERVGADALPVLAGALSDPSIEVRANVVRTIARIGGDGAIAPLTRALQDDALAVRKRAERALVEMGDAVLPALTLAAEEERPEAREELRRIIDEIHRKGP